MCDTGHDEDAAKQAKQATKEYNRQYYEKNRYILCYKTLNVYCNRKIEYVRSFHAAKIDEYFASFPFENYAEPYIRKCLFTHRVFKHHAHYDDCFDAGMFAYLYSIHRCAEMSYSHVAPYIKKVVRIYILCALVIHDDTKNLCTANGFKQIRLDTAALAGRF